MYVRLFISIQEAFNKIHLSLIYSLMRHCFVTISEIFELFSSSEELLSHLLLRIYTYYFFFGNELCTYTRTYSVFLLLPHRTRQLYRIKSLRRYIS